LPQNPAVVAARFGNTLVEELIRELEDAIASIQQQHHRWQRRAKLRLNLDMDNLAA
jgi:hypothetical protein